MSSATFDFEVINIDALEELAKERTLLPYKKVNGKKDERWNTKLITSKVMSGILNGDSIPKIAKSFREVMDMNRVSSIRNARTSITSCENRGRLVAMENCEEMGVVMKKQWMATHDGRTRDSHLRIDGETIDIHEYFSNGLMEPGDTDGEPEEVYNCRCTMVSVVEGFNFARSKNADVANAYTDDDVKYLDSIENERASVMEMPANKQGAYLLKHDAGSKDELLSAVKNGTIDDYTARYFDALQDNGSVVSRKPLVDQPVLSGSGDFSEQRKSMIQALTGVSKESADEMYNALNTWVGNRWDLADTNLLNKYIDSAGTYDGQIWRGLHFDTLSDRDNFLANAQVGSVMAAGQNGKTASWSSEESTALTFANTGNHSVIMKCVKNSSSTPIAYMNKMGEPEVLSHSDARYTVLGIIQEGDENKSRTIITVIERERGK